MISYNSQSEIFKAKDKSVICCKIITNYKLHEFFQLDTVCSYTLLIFKKSNFQQNNSS